MPNRRSRQVFSKLPKNTKSFAKLLERYFFVVFAKTQRCQPDLANCWRLLVENLQDVLNGVIALSFPLVVSVVFVNNSFFSCLIKFYQRGPHSLFFQLKKFV